MFYRSKHYKKWIFYDQKISGHNMSVGPFSYRLKEPILVLSFELNLKMAYQPLTLFLNSRMEPATWMARMSLSE